MADGTLILFNNIQRHKHQCLDRNFCRDKNNNKLYFMDPLLPSLS